MGCGSIYHAYDWIIDTEELSMTPEQKVYFDNEVKEMRRGGRGNHSAFVVNSISGMGSSNLGPLDPPVVGFSQEDDPFYTQYLRDWNEVEKLIAQLREEATKAWGENVTTCSLLSVQQNKD